MSSGIRRPELHVRAARLARACCAKYGAAIPKDLLQVLQYWQSSELGLERAAEHSSRTPPSAESPTPKRASQPEESHDPASSHPVDPGARHPPAHRHAVAAAPQVTRHSDVRGHADASVIAQIRESFEVEVVQ